MFMGYHYNKTMFYININLTMEETMQNIKTKTNTALSKMIKMLNQYHMNAQTIKDLSATNKMIREVVLENKTMFPINDKNKSGLVADVYEQTRNVFNTKLFKDKHLDLYHEFTDKQIVNIIKTDIRK